MLVDILELYYFKEYQNKKINRLKINQDQAVLNWAVLFVKAVALCGQAVVMYALMILVVQIAMLLYVNTANNINLIENKNDFFLFDIFL